MVFPRAFVKVVLSGTMLNGREIWSCSLSLDSGFTQENSESIRENLLPALLPAATTWFSARESYIHNTAQLRVIKANTIGTNGRYLSDSDSNYLDVAEGTVRGGSSASPMPPQVTAAVSLLTARQRGLASRGRFFPPALAAGIDPNTGGLSSSTTGEIATSAAGLLSAINAIEGYTVSVASEMREGRIEPVTRVAVGSVVDTQRRRRSDLPEIYAGAAVTGG